MSMHCALRSRWAHRVAAAKTLLNRIYQLDELDEAPTVQKSKTIRLGHLFLYSLEGSNEEFRGHWSFFAF